MNIENDVIIFLCLIILIGCCFFIFVKYVYIIITLNKVLKIEHDMNRVRNHYDRNKMETLLKSALIIAHDNANKYSQPYFYNQTLEKILEVEPNYKGLMEFASYARKYDEESAQDINIFLIKWFGDNYPGNTYLNVPVTIKVNNFQNSSFNHYIMIDIDRAMTIYKNNKSQL